MGGIFDFVIYSRVGGSGVVRHLCGNERDPREENLEIEELNEKLDIMDIMRCGCSLPSSGSGSKKVSS